MVKDTRIPVYDTARALCTIHIIIFWHGVMYFYPDSLIIKVGVPVTVAALACFTFQSGLFNSVNNGALSFYKNRIKRLYIPFVLAYFLLIVIGLNTYNITDTLLSLTGLSCFFGGQPNTLWYICMLLVFYMMTPLIIYNASRTTVEGCKKIALRCAIIYLIFFFMARSLPLFECRILYYFPFYALGLIFQPKNLYKYIHSSKKTNLIRIGYASVMFCATVLLAVLCEFSFLYNEILINVLYGMFGTILLLLVSDLISKMERVDILLSAISYSSMFAYMYHRFIFFMCMRLMISCHPILILLVESIILFPICYYIQKGYDRILDS